MAEHVREEWLVTGQPTGNFPRYRYVFGGPNEADRTGSPEQRARNFVRLTTERGGWVEGPFLHHRTVTTTDWVVASTDTEEER